MFTWNFQYISRARLGTSLEQMMLEPKNGEVLIRIHTAMHLGEEAVELARFIKSIVPGATVIGTSTSAVINRGKLLLNQCAVSVTQMTDCHVSAAILPTVDGRSGQQREASEVFREAAGRLILNEDTKLTLGFSAGEYSGFRQLIDCFNRELPGVPMTGGIINHSDLGQQKDCGGGFVFNETGYTNAGILLAAFNGASADCVSSYATGAQGIGSPYEITDSIGNVILELEGKDAAEEFRSGVGAALLKNPELTELFPLVYEDEPDIPVSVCTEDITLAGLFPPEDPKYAEFYRTHPGIDPLKKTARIRTDHMVTPGRKLLRAFIYDRKIIADNHTMFRHAESFEKAEMLFGYSDVSRSLIYSNCAKWELSVYENSGIFGCATTAEIVFANGKNTLACGAFSVTVMGESAASQEYNPFAFSHTDSLVADNQALLNYLTEIRNSVKEGTDETAVKSLRAFVRDCEMKLLYSEQGDIPNEASLTMDMKMNGYDRICMIHVPDTASMRLVFPEETIDVTRRSFIGKCVDFARRRNYRLYLLGEWEVAIGAPSYTCSVPEMTKALEFLQKNLFNCQEGMIAIVPIFCLMNGCTADNLKNVYNSARLAMLQKNIQFYVCDADSFQADEDSIRERYNMVNVINYAIANDKIIPYYQGIYDNESKSIHHYESLMRIEDEAGTVYTPYRFMEVARSYGLLYDSMSLVMMKKVFERFSEADGVSVSINLALRDIKNRTIMEFVYDSLAAAAHPENFVFEILENEDVDAYDVLEVFVDRIHQLGGKISIDDFGSGYSNLQHVISIHADYLKIDGSIVRKCCEDREAENLITLIMGWKAMTTNTTKVIAEYVENEEIQQMLLRYGVDYSQGFLFSRPTPNIAV